MDSYSRCVNKFIQFSLQHGVDPQFIPSGLLAEFFTDIARRSDHPKSILDVNSAALACYYQALDHPSPIDSDVRKLIAGLVKSGTTEVMRRSLIMPRQPFMELFERWPDNDNLSLEYLRLKVLTLMSLVLMLRPSDVAPHAITIKKSGVESLQFTADRVVKCEDGSLDIHLLGIKNDYNRDGFCGKYEEIISGEVVPGTCVGNLIT